jgi:Co/Zn/Cd efflux system component
VNHGYSRTLGKEASLVTQAFGDGSLGRAVVIVALANLAYFGVEFAVASRIGSVSLFADSVDFLEDASVNLLILLALGWSSRSRSRLGLGLALLLLIPGAATLWTAWLSLTASGAPDAIGLTVTGVGALAVNLSCAFLIARHRHAGGSLTKAAFLSARNDAIANVAIIAAGMITVALPWRWWDLCVGLGIAAMNADAARAVWRAAREEGRQAQA